MLIAKSEGHYHFLKGIDPYSCGVIADPGWEIVHVTLEQAVPWRQGFDRVEAHLQEVGRDRQALCGMELRSPAPFTMAGFIAFNRGLLSGAQGMGPVRGRVESSSPHQCGTAVRSALGTGVACIFLYGASNN